MAEVSFKEKVAQIAIAQSKIYKAIFVDYEYLLCSDAFVKKDYYIISAKEDNYRHLIGVNTAINAGDFFEKCINGTLTENDFDFCKRGRTEKEVKGSVRRKIKVLPLLMNMIGKDMVAQEDFSKNHIACAMATTDCYVTVGFVETGKARPMTLLLGDELDWSKVQAVDLVLRKKVGEAFFSEIIVGDADAIKKYYSKIKLLIASELYEDETFLLLE